MGLQKKLKLVCGVGVNDADYVIRPLIDGKQYKCKFYQNWTNMLERCYDKKYQERSKTYIGCSVCPEWLIFSNFKSWMETQDWQGKSLDKDILVVGNKVYSPASCAFVSMMTNNFVVDRAAMRGNCSIGVCFHIVFNKFQAGCNNPFTGKHEFLGRFDCENEANLAWRKRKHELACQLADLQTDDRVACALRLRYA